jgi:hypothetical protein
MSEAKRVFSQEELAEFSKDYIALALEALERGDTENAKTYLRKQDATKNLMHDLYLHWVAALMSHIYDHWGEDEAVTAIRETVRGFSLPFLEQKTRLLRERGMRGWIEELVDVWRQHASHPGLSVTEDEEKITFTLQPCGSGGRLIDMGAYEGPNAYRRLMKAGPHTWGEEGIPIYCSHCPWAHELLPQEAGGKGAQLWVHAAPFPQKPGDPCIHHFYKDPSRIPGQYYRQVRRSQNGQPAAPAVAAIPATQDDAQRR